MSTAEPVVPRPESDDEKWFLEGHLGMLRKLVIDVAYTYGLKMRSEIGESFYRSPRWSDLAVWWDDSYSCLNLVIRAEGYKHERQIFGRGRIYDYSRNFDMRVATYTDDLLALFLPGIRIERSIRQCSMPIHFPNHWRPKSDPLRMKIDLDPKVAACRNKDGRWFCAECEERYSLPAPSLQPPPTRLDAAAKERAKMTNGLRFEVLARDNFTCGICGRSPLKGDDVKLHVDHKMPISKGGKTEMDNLWVLCRDCNLGKRDKVVTQLTLGLDQVEHV